MTTRLLTLEQQDLFGPEAVATSLSGREEISRPFEFYLSVASPLLDLQPEQLIGKPLGVRIDRGDQPPRFIHGFITHMWAGDNIRGEDAGSGLFRLYRVRLAPWTWFMMRAARSFVYLPEKELKSMAEVLEEVKTRVSEYMHVEPLWDTDNAAILEDHKVEHCVQYRETDFSFLSRTLERLGIYYRFEFTGSQHTMILSDQSSYPSCVESRVEYRTLSAGTTEADSIHSWEHVYEFVSGEWQQKDFDPMKPSEDLTATAFKHADVSLTNNTGYQLYDFPNDYAAHHNRVEDAERRMQEEELRFNMVTGSSTCKTFTAGQAFRLTEHANVDTERAKSYLLIQVLHSAKQPGPFASTGSSPSYSNEFTCIPRDTQYRPQRSTAQPFLPSVQTAFVVGPEDEEIHVDKFGRVKVKFHWDRDDTPGEHHSCWLRVSQVHAGKGWGAIDIPRVGEEVIVSFIDGSPDRPIITGRVYNAEAMPPFTLPDEKTRSGIKTKTYKGTGYNELTMDDKTGKEQIRIHAQRDMESTVRRNRSASIGSSDSSYVGGNQSLTVKKKQTTIVEEDRDMWVKGTQRHQTDGDHHITVKGKRIEAVDGGITLDTKSFNLLTSDLVGFDGNEISMAANKIVLDATSELTLKVGGNFIKIDASGVTIVGLPVKINSGGAAGTGTLVVVDIPEPPEAAEVPPPPPATGP